jgi:hypothetical protein
MQTRASTTEAYLVVGIIADAQRLNRTRLEFGEIFNLINGLHREE